MEFSLTKKSKHQSIKPHFSWNPIHPRGDWRKLFVVFLILSVLVVGWSAYLFFSSQGHDQNAVLVPVAEEKDVSQQIERISELFEKRSAPEVAPL